LRTNTHLAHHQPQKIIRKIGCFLRLEPAERRTQETGRQHLPGILTIILVVGV